ncbi:TIGR03854 family LLM class F420-dependent oxidoreductase [Saccharopolyspora phatthalungensis]|uniref:Putative F420-dependent oxidoreductase n=1 Tax=Saccharopolyspora phatthalungensis TaxID=664693 RepID=A0A840QHS2_9PSEU|nr:TIGR03854 family LLM class F420-dependent oxidoreductase [Saccharopolyspora phatthalungensis]MBB5159761.1 putative F420-dependent oxidoreductase [Saccharopolyspora phatthalungensis]
MKIRIGVGLGAQHGTPDVFADIVDRLEAAGVDSLWLSEFIYSPQVDPFIGMTHALARTARLKVGTGVAVLPGRHPVLVAKQLATLAGLAPRRVLPVFGLRPDRRRERDLFAVPPGRRGAVFDESLHLVRRLLTQDEVTHHGEFFDIEDASIGPRPAKPVDIWLGGSSPAGLCRVGRYGDGWLASLLSPGETRHGRQAIEAAAAEAGREIEADHYGISIPVATDGIPADLLASVRDRRPDADPAELVAASWPDARRMVEGHLAAGLTKFVIRPADPTGSFDDFLHRFTEELLPLQN